MIADSRTFRTGTGDEGAVLIIGFDRGSGESKSVHVLIAISAMASLGCPAYALFDETNYKVPREPNTRDFISYPLEGEGRCHIPLWRVADKCGRYPSGFR